MQIKRILIGFVLGMISLGIITGIFATESDENTDIPRTLSGRCGDGICDGNELQTCAKDCPQPPPDKSAEEREKAEEEQEQQKLMQMLQPLLEKLGQGGGGGGEQGGSEQGGEGSGEDGSGGSGEGQDGQNGEQGGNGDGPAGNGQQEDGQEKEPGNDEFGNSNSEVQADCKAESYGNPCTNPTECGNNECCKVYEKCFKEEKGDQCDQCKIQDKKCSKKPKEEHCKDSQCNENGCQESVKKKCEPKAKKVKEEYKQGQVSCDKIPKPELKECQTAFEKSNPGKECWNIWQMQQMSKEDLQKIKNPYKLKQVGSDLQSRAQEMTPGQYDILGKTYGKNGLPKDFNIGLNQQQADAFRHASANPINGERELGNRQGVQRSAADDTARKAQPPQKQGGQGGQQQGGQQGNQVGDMLKGLMEQGQEKQSSSSSDSSSGGRPPEGESKDSGFPEPKEKTNDETDLAQMMVAKFRNTTTEGERATGPALKTVENNKNKKTPAVAAQALQDFNIEFRNSLGQTQSYVDTKTGFLHSTQGNNKLVFVARTLPKSVVIEGKEAVIEFPYAKARARVPHTSPNNIFLLSSIYDTQKVIIENDDFRTIFLDSFFGPIKPTNHQEILMGKDARVEVLTGEQVGKGPGEKTDRVTETMSKDTIIADQTSLTAVRYPYNSVITNAPPDRMVVNPINGETFTWTIPPNNPETELKGDYGKTIVSYNDYFASEKFGRTTISKTSKGLFKKVSYLIIPRDDVRIDLLSGNYKSTGRFVSFATPDKRHPLGLTTMVWLKNWNSGLGTSPLYEYAIDGIDEYDYLVKGNKIIFAPGTKKEKNIVSTRNLGGVASSLMPHQARVVYTGIVEVKT